MSTEPATPPAVSPSPAAPGPAVPPEGHEGHEGQNTGSAMRIVSYREVAEHVYEVVMESITYGQESITYGQRTRRVLVLPESLMGDEETPKGNGQGDDQGPRYGWTLSGFKAREAAKKFSEGMISGLGAEAGEMRGDREVMD
jgi:hypothetical protein